MGRLSLADLPHPALEEQRKRRIMELERAKRIAEIESTTWRVQVFDAPSEPWHCGVWTIKEGHRAKFERSFDNYLDAKAFIKEARGSTWDVVILDRNGRTIHRVGQVVGNGTRRTMKASVLSSVEWAYGTQPASELARQFKLSKELITAIAWGTVDWIVVEG